MSGIIFGCFSTVEYVPTISGFLQLGNIGKGGGKSFLLSNKVREKKERENNNVREKKRERDNNPCL